MQICRRKSLLAITWCVAFAVFGAAQEHPQHAWDYGEARGPSHWGDLKPEFALCKSGHHQSPIDIRNPHQADLPSIRFEYKPSRLHVIDNGHTVMVNYDPGSSITVGGKTYVLKQFHFHRPSEEKINGQAYAMAVHLVHADQEDKLAVVAVLLQEGTDNPLVRQAWKEFPTQKKKKKFLNDNPDDPMKNPPCRSGYYTFSGSLTTPPC